MQTLADFLTENSIRQTAFAAQVGRTQATISRIVSGEAKPSLALALAIERATGGKVPVQSWGALDGFQPSEAAE